MLQKEFAFQEQLIRLEVEGVKEKKKKDYFQIT